MKIKEVKPIGKVGKSLLENKDAKQIIETIIEKPLQKACLECTEKNIETVMSSCNKKNIVKVKVNKKDIIKNLQLGKQQSFLDLGKGYSWLMINFNTLSYLNRKILFELENELGEDAIVFVKSCYIDFINKIRKFFGKKLLVENFDDAFSDEFKDKQIKLIYNNKYPNRSVFIRMPIEENTDSKDVEKYFENIILNLKKQ